MPMLPQSRFLRMLLVGSTAAVVICYAWLAAHVLEPQFSTPDFVSETFVRTQDSHVFLLEDRQRSYSRETTRLSIELTALDPLLKWLGAIKHPIEILIDEKQPERLLVTDARIEIGRNVLLARNQLSKAVLKSWLLQNAASQITSSYLRLEAASDVLLAMLQGELSLEVPGFEEPLEFDETGRAWWTYADNYNGVCGSPWKSLELADLCQSKVVKTDATNVSELSFRAFLGSRVWSSYRALPMSERLPFVRNWVGILEMPREVKIPSLKAGWLAVVQSELDVLLPGAMDPLVAERAKWASQIDVPLIVIDSQGRMTAPGTLKLASSAEIPITHARLAVMTTCAAPSLGDVMALQPRVDRVVWRPECKERKADFVQARPSAIGLALQHGFAEANDHLDKFVMRNRSSEAGRWLGLADAKWDKRVNAYQVHGAIQAVETFRLSMTDSKDSSKKSSKN